MQSRLQKYFICRAGWMMGGGKDKDKKFIKKIMDQILAGQDTLYIVNDKLGTLLAYDFANNVLQHRDSVLRSSYGMWGHNGN